MKNKSRGEIGRLLEAGLVLSKLESKAPICLKPCVVLNFTFVSQLRVKVIFLILDITARN